MWVFFSDERTILCYKYDDDDDDDDDTTTTTNHFFFFLNKACLYSGFQKHNIFNA